jgi:hypothetical protein
MRLHLFEFEDQAWFPQILRDYQTGFLGFMSAHAGLYRNAPRGLALAGASSIADLASGNGDAAVHATSALRAAGCKLYLCDKFPSLGLTSRHAQAEGVHYIAQSVDVVNDSLPEAEAYTMFNAFHHFTEAEKYRILYEPLQRNMATFLKVLLATTLGLVLITPFIRPLRLNRIVLTYFLPVGIFVTCWDGLVSVLRAPSRQALSRLKASAASQELTLEHQKLPSKFTSITYFHFS